MLLFFLRNLLWICLWSRPSSAVCTVVCTVVYNVYSDDHITPQYSQVTQSVNIDSASPGLTRHSQVSSRIFHHIVHSSSYRFMWSESESTDRLIPPRLLNRWPSTGSCAARPPQENSSDLTFYHLLSHGDILSNNLNIRWWSDHLNPVISQCCSVIGDFTNSLK